MNNLHHLTQLSHLEPAVGAPIHNATEFTLVDSATNVESATFDKSSNDFGQAEDPGWWMKFTTLHGGKQQGSQLAIIDNGAIQFGVSPTRGMGITYFAVKGNEPFPIGWKSPIQEVVNPSFVNLESRGGLGWLDGFGEWLCRCGLEFAGEPGVDIFTTDAGGTSKVNCTLHGKTSNTPASRVTFTVGDTAPHTLRLRGTVCEYSYHGAKLRLETEISTEPGSLWLEVKDVITNVGAKPQEFQLIYHCNYGDPILEQGAKVVGAFKHLQPWTDHAANSLKGWETCEAPNADFVEQVYLAEAVGDGQGRTAILLQNAEGTLGSSISWRTDSLPYVSIWKNTVARADGYVVGLEPGTGYPNNRQVERQLGRVPKLMPGESREFSLRFTVHPSAISVAQVREQIEHLQATCECKIVPTSLKSELQA
ncbi:aldose 1-epimerase family protein [Aeoliella sp. SH292]|uniref:aldose 1-epimerase family protein n=1 Tax=Aeoliella sp. SH292 TaxID=3454464 RepID=UPI003F953E41